MLLNSFCCPSGAPHDPVDDHLGPLARRPRLRIIRGDHERPRPASDGRTQRYRHQICECLDPTICDDFRELIPLFLVAVHARLHGARGQDKNRRALRRVEHREAQAHPRQGRAS